MSPPTAVGRPSWMKSFGNEFVEVKVSRDEASTIVTALVGRGHDCCYAGGRLVVNRTSFELLADLLQKKDIASDERITHSRVAPSVDPQIHQSTRTHSIQISLDGVDLEEVAERVGLTPEQVRETFFATELTVDSIGFLPGFAYLVGLPRHLHLPRRATPRTHVPAGSLAIAAGYAGIYPQVVPGGWHLIGHVVNFTCFDPARFPPSPFLIGDRVKWIEV